MPVLKVERVAVEVVAHHHVNVFKALHRLVHHERHLAVHVAEHRPSVGPAARHEQRHAAYGSAVLKDEAIPVAVSVVNDGALSGIGEAGKVVFKYHLLLIRSGYLVGTVAQLSARLVLRP